MAKLYVLAEKLQDIKAKNSAIEASLILGSDEDTNGNSWIPHSGCINTIYNGTVKGNLGRKLILDYMKKAELMKAGMMERFDEYPKEFLDELASALLKLRSDASWPVMDHWRAYMEDEKEGEKQ